MSGSYYGDFPTSHTAVCMPFDSFAAATGAPSAVTNFANTDIQIYKDGGTTQRSSAAGITVTTSFDTNTGLQMVVIDLSDNTDAGFYAAGHEYSVAVADITVDSQTLRFWLGSFSIERAGGALALLKAGTAKCTLADGVAHGGTLGTSTATLALSRLSVVSQSSNTAAVTATGNGTGSGIVATSGTGATGDGIQANAASTNGKGMSALGTGTGAGVVMTGGATGHGLSLVGGATSGSGLSTVASTSGDGITATGVGTTKHGIKATGGSTSSCGILATGGGTGSGIEAQSGSGAASVGLKVVANGSGGPGMYAAGNGAGSGIQGVGGTSGSGLQSQGGGGGAGAQFLGGATGHAFVLTGGSTSGSGLHVTTTSGHGINLAPVGTNVHGIISTGGNGGTSDGINAVAGTGGVPIRGNITGNITGNLSGSVGSVTGNVDGNVTGSVGSLTTNNDKTGYALTSAYDFAKGTVAVTESYNADGAAPTPVQALMMIMQMLTDKDVSGTTLTVHKLDGTTSAATFTLNDGTSPTSITRAA